MEYLRDKVEKASKFYLTTPIYYVNASPHVGHAYTNIIADCMARFKRMCGDDVFFLTGTDEHGEKVKKVADGAGKDVKSFVDEVSQNFVVLWKRLNISYDFFIRTTDEAHVQVVQKVIQALYEKGDIYKAKYRGFYCMPCESFWTEPQVKEAGGREAGATATCKASPTGVCPDCKRPVEEIEEENYFFKLSKYEDWLRSYLKDNPDFIKPKMRYNEVMGFLETNHLVDLCISRPRKRVSWGITFPFDENYVVYVWFDALLNYISAVGFYRENDRFKALWPADIHFMAKDILKQHAVFWPIMLKALDIEPPAMVFAHGWWKIGEEKISKSRGNVVNPLELIEELGMGEAGVDALRYFLLREVPVGADGNFSFSALVNRTNSDLANDLGNLVYRTLNMAEKYFQGTVSGGGIPAEFKEALYDLESSYMSLMSHGEFSLSLEKIFRFINVMNKYIENTKPWALWKEKKEDEVRNFLYALLEGIRIVSLYLYPVIPFAAISIYRQIGAVSDFNISHKTWGLQKSFVIKRQAPLFPRIETK